MVSDFILAILSVLIVIVGSWAYLKVYDKTLFATKLKEKKMEKFEIYKDKKGEFRFRFISSNGRIICSSEGYKSRRGVMNGVYCVLDNAYDADINDLTK